jgi:DNA mismatch repair protein MutS
MKILDKSNYTPMMQQYLTIKENYQDSLIFFRLGDFYELFFNDALVASRVLEIALTGREAGVEERVPMCGVPHHSASNYIQRLVDNGFKVAIVEQVEDPKEAKGIVKRDVVRLITPGTVMDEQFLNEKDNHYIASVTDHTTHYLVSYCDLTTGSCFVTLLDKNDAMLRNELLSIHAKEIVCADNFNRVIIDQMVQEYQLTLSFENEVDMPEDYQYMVTELTDTRYHLAVGRLVNYLLKTQKRDLKHLQKAESYQSNQYLMLDVYSKRNLELTETLRTHTRKGSLLWLLDQAETAMGSRMIKQWLEKPLINREEINWRYDFVQAMLDDFIVREEIRNHLKEVYDLERLVGRIAYDHANAKDLLQLKRSLKQVPFIKEQLAKFNKAVLRHLNQIQDFKELTDLLEAGIHEDAPYTLKDGGLINDGFSKELDDYRDIAKNGKAYLANLIQRERERTGIKNLKIGFNKVFGYYIEITKGNLNSLPPDLGYERKQTLANAERFITPELKEMEAKILQSEERSIALEYDLFLEIRNEIKKHMPSLQVLAKSIAILDALISFAVVSNNNRLTRPQLVDEHRIKIINGRHPVVEKVLTDSIYVENDILMNEETNVLLITGPNMSGKSTYMRQMALTVIMAQIGCFVPCDVCEMKIFDKIYTRIGASDDLASGQSTFMVEMLEANNAILNASEHSLILFDEIGRGTATFDGMALAQSIIEYIHERIGCKMLFSTHYHELTVLENPLENLKNVHVRAEEHDGELTFLHKVEFGPSDKSYGIQVAKLAKLPSSVIKRAEKILIKLEKNKHDIVEEPEVNLFNMGTDLVIDPFADEVVSTIEGMNVSEMTPIEALNTLYQLQTKIKNKK